MPTFAYEAMDKSGLEVKDTIEAASEAEAQTLIREKGFYVTRIREKEKKKKEAKKGGGAKAAAGTRLCSVTCCTVASASQSRIAVMATAATGCSGMWISGPMRRSTPGPGIGGSTGCGISTA